MGTQVCSQSVKRAALLPVVIVAALALDLPLLAGEDPLPSLAGTWAEVQVYSEILPFPIVGQITNTNTATLRVEIEQSASSLVLQDRYCRITVKSANLLVSMEIPEALLCLLIKGPGTAALEASPSGVSFVRPWQTRTSGLLLERPDDEPLPESAADPRVIDEDGDGHPGVTVRLRVLGVIEGEVYLVQRMRYRLVGTVVSPDRIEGYLEWRSERVVLGASSPLFVGDWSGTPDPDPAKSTFVLQRIDPTWDCAALMENWGAVVGR